MSTRDRSSERGDPEVQLLRDENALLRERLSSLSRLSVRITSSLDLPVVLQEAVDAACELTAARYGALGVFDAAGKIRDFITHGVTPEERRRIGDPPKGSGLLGWLEHVQEPLRLADLAQHPRSAGFPPNHPPMKSFLGAPIRLGEARLGNLYLTEKAGERPFTQEDEELLVLFAAQAAVAIHNAHLHQSIDAERELRAKLEERERIGMDLHDGVIQSIYAVGLGLDGAAHQLEEAPHDARRRLDRAIDDLNGVIEDIRGYVFDLRPQVAEAADLPRALSDLVEKLRVNTLIQAELRLDGQMPALDREQAVELFHIAQEALTNVAKHSRASSVDVRLSGDDRTLSLEISDNGVGFDPEARYDSQRQGLRNITDRARRLGASLSIDSEPGRRTRVQVALPVPEEGT
jgi:signal transduction histidine kinase